MTVSKTSSKTRLMCCLLGWLLLLVPLAAHATKGESEQSYKTYGAAEAKKVVQQPERWITADHSRHEVLKETFTSGPEVTEACLSCHNEAGRQFHQVIHWTWLCPADPENKMGKAGLTLNNF